MTNVFSELTTKLDPLRPFVERIATVRYANKKLFSSILRASFVRAFEFVDLVSTQKSISAFFFAPALRSITEDIILLRFLSRFPHEVRQQTLNNMLDLIAADALYKQEAFFQTFRPFQPILPAASMDIQKTIKHRDELRSFWQNNGWPNLNRSMPQTRQIAEKSDPEVLHVVYDFIYRMTSDAVHFNPHALLRLGWGDVPREATFSTRNTGRYYLSMSCIYGSYLLCLYFELFSNFLKLNQKEKAGVVGIREYLLGIPRWPEMITFEEMNLDLPRHRSLSDRLLYAIHHVIMKDGFISGTKQMIALRENQRSRSSKEVPQQ